MAKAIKTKKAACEGVACGYETGIVKTLSILNDSIAMKADELADALVELQDITDIAEEGYAIRDTILAKMGELRAFVDKAETLTAKSYWPYPSYADLLFGVK